ncbi:MAG: ABC transporter permease [Spirochaetales bacterium]|nr:ABC transporter permease [Spirochaetales bacterium]
MRTKRSPMILFSVCRKNLISSLRGEYVDFIISRFTFTFFTMATGFVLYKLGGGRVSQVFQESTGGNNYLGFMVVGTALYGTTHGILLNVSRTLMTERREGTLDSILMIPFSRWQYYGGNQLNQIILTSLDIILACVLSLILGVQFDLNAAGLAAGFFQFFITLYGLALLLSLLMISLKDTFFIQNTIIPIILLIGGYIFPIEVLPGFLRFLSEIVPIHYGVFLIRSAVLEGGGVVGWAPYLKSLIPGLIFLCMGFGLLPVIERKALEEYLS